MLFASSFVRLPESRGIFWSLKSVCSPATKMQTVCSHGVNATGVPSSIGAGDGAVVASVGFALPSAVKVPHSLRGGSIAISTGARKVQRSRRTATHRVNAMQPVAELSGKFGIEGIDVLEGTGGLPKIRLHDKNKSEAEIYLHGGVITSWKSKGKELLHVRPDAVFDGVKPISGGMPHCFPQFGPGPLQQHGFARNVSWTVVNSSNETDTPSVTLELRDGEYSRAMWDYRFLVKYTVTLDGEKLKTELVIKNVDHKPFTFTTALHTYFSGNVGDAVITGLNGLNAFDKHPVTKEPLPTVETRDMVRFGGFVDRVYLDAPNRLVLRNGHGDTIAIENEGWPDAVVWNPHMTMKLYYKDFVCIENAKLAPPFMLQPRKSWTAKTVFGPIDVPDVTCPPTEQLEGLLEASDLKSNETLKSD